MKEVVGIEGIKELKYRDFNSNTLYIKLANYTAFYYNSSYGNCKHCVLNGISNVKLTDKNVEILNALFEKTCKLCFTINVTQKNIIDDWSKHFKLISIQKVPIGYYDGYQYHAMFFTNNKQYSSRKDYIKRVERENNKNKIEINQTNITKEDLLKIKNYKMDYYRNQFIDKLLTKN